MVSRGGSPGTNSKPFAAKVSPKELSAGTVVWQTEHVTRYLRANAGMPKRSPGESAKATRANDTARTIATIFIVRLRAVGILRIVGEHRLPTGTGSAGWSCAPRNDLQTSRTAAAASPRCGYRGAGSRGGGAGRGQRRRV